MALSLQSISKKAAVRAPRILIVGREKIGKTTFACGSRFENGRLVEIGRNKPIVIPIKGEEGADDLGVPCFPTIHTYEELLEALGVLYAETHEHRTVVVDSASALERLVWDYVCRQHGVDSIEKVLKGYGKGYVEAAKAWARVTEGLDALRAAKDMACVLIGHVKVKGFNDPTGDQYDNYTFDVNEKAAALIQRWVDFIGFASSKVVVKKEEVDGFGREKSRGIDVAAGARFLFTQQRAAHPGGGRGVYGRLPYELPLDWSAFEAAVADAMSNGGEA